MLCLQLLARGLCRSSQGPALSREGNCLITLDIFPFVFAFKLLFGFEGPCGPILVVQLCERTAHCQQDRGCIVGAHNLLESRAPAVDSSVKVK